MKYTLTILTILIKIMVSDITESDIMYQDKLVCILKPNVKKGVIVWHRYNQPAGMMDLCKSGLKTGKKTP